MKNLLLIALIALPGLLSAQDFATFGGMSQVNIQVQMPGISIGIEHENIMFGIQAYMDRSGDYNICNANVYLGAMEAIPYLSTGAILGFKPNWNMYAGLKVRINIRRMYFDCDFTTDHTSAGIGLRF